MISSDLKRTEEVNLSVSKANRSIGTLKNVFRRQFFKLSLLSSNKSSSGLRGRDLVSIFEKGHFKIRKCSEKSNQNGKGSETFDKQRIKILGLDFLEWRRKRGDLISTFKLIKGLDSAKLINNFNINSSLQGKNLRRQKFQMKRETAQ